MAVLFFGYCQFIYIRQYLRERTLVRQRLHVTSASFVDYFRDQPVSQDLCLKLYTQIPRILTVSRRFPLLPTDNLEEVFHVCPYTVELDELLEELIPFCGLPYPCEEQIEKACGQVRKVKTVADLVLLLGIIERKIKGDAS